MLEHLPQGVGRALRGLRSGLDELAWTSPAADAAPEVMTLESPAFEDGQALPLRFTQDSPVKTSPSLIWRGAPVDAAAVVLVVEDADSPTPVPIAHAVAWNLPVADRIEEGQLTAQEASPEHLGWNSFHRPGWLPPDPPPGHGPHRYVFQVFALDRPLQFERTPGRREILAAMRGRVRAKGRLIGTYERL